MIVSNSISILSNIDNTLSKLLLVNVTDYFREPTIVP